MKATILHDELKLALGAVARAVSTKTTFLPVLSNIYLEAKDDCLYLASTNLDTGIQAWIPAKVKEEGAYTVPAKTFVELIGTLSGQIDLKLDGPSLQVICQGSKNKIKGIDADEFVVMPERITDGIQLDGASLKRMIKMTAFAASTEEARPTLTGILVDLSDQISMVTADGFRLSVAKAPLPQPASGKILIQAKGMAELARILIDAPVTMQINPGAATFSVGNTQVTIGRIEGNYPDYNQIIPKKWTTRVDIPVKALIQGLQQARVFARDGSHSTILTINEDHITVLGKSGKTGQSETYVDASVEGEPMEIAFNVDYLYEAMKVIDTPNVTLEMTSDTSPAKFYPAGDRSFEHVLMPMHLEGVK